MKCIPIFAFLLLLAACESEGPSLGATLNEIEDDPAAFSGRHVIVSGEINQVLGPTSFTIGGEPFGHELLVIAPAGTDIIGGRDDDPPFNERDIVQVVGTVRQYAVVELEEEYDVDLTPDLDAEYEGTEPSVVADRIYLSPRLRQIGGGERGLAPITDIAMVVEADTVDTPEGRPVHLENLTVQSVLSDSTFWVGDDTDQGIFVVLEKGTRGDPTSEGRYDFSAGQTISLTGTLMLLPAEEYLRDRWNLDEHIMSLLRDEGVYIRADSLLQ